MISFDENEYVMFEVRRHWFVIAGQTMMLFIFSLIPLVLYMIYISLGFTPDVPQEAVLIFYFLYGLWVLGLWIALFIMWTDYYLDIWIVTNKKIFHIEQNGIFRREISTLRLDRIQDVTVEVNGIIPTFLNYGDLHVQTAAQQREFVIRDVAKPHKTRELINKALEQHKGYGEGL